LSLPLTSVRPAVARVLLLTALLTVAVMIVLALEQDEPTPPPVVSTTSTTQVPATPTLLYAVEGPSGEGFRPRGSVVAGTRVYTADREGARLAIFDLARGQGATFSYLPIAPERPEDALPYRPEPTDVVTLPDGLLLVADPANGRVWRVTPDGVLLGDFPEARDRQRSRLAQPVGLARSADEVYVTDVSDHRVKVYSIDGRFRRAFGGEGFREGDLSFPSGLAVGADGVAYVADSNNRRVEVFDANGAFAALLTETGAAEGLGLPRGIAIDRLGRLHVADAFGQAVYVYEGGELPTIEYGRERSDGDDGLAAPEGIVITADRIVVSDSGAARMVVYGY
jgi:DNA-binding beta-propeller fold protein YncE